jgi:hypothetical protein
MPPQQTHTLQACPSRVPPSPGLALSSRDCSYVILVAIHARNSEDHRCLAPSASLFSPSSTASNLDTNSHSLLQPPGRPRSNCTAELCLGAPLCSSPARSLPPGPPFSSTNLDRFLRSRTCTSHDSAASTRREPSTCSPSHQGPADRTLKAGKMLLSLAGRTPRLGKRRPWSRNQAGKGGVGLRYHTPGEARGPNLLYCTVSWTAVHANGSHIVCMQRCNAEVAPSTSFPFGCGLLRLATSYGRAAENNSLRRGTAPGRDLLDRPTSMLTKHKS